MKTRTAFTLIELLVVVAIIGLLVSITMPSLSAARRAGRSAKCRYNLHQVGVAMEAYFGTNAEFFPSIAVLPSNEANAAQAEGGRPLYKPIPVVLKNEIGNKTQSQVVVRNEVFECPSDVIAKDNPEFQAIGLFPGRRYYDTETTSYEWNPFLNPDYDSTTNKVGPQKRRRLRGTSIVNDFVRASLSQLQMIYDFEHFHGSADRKGSINCLYADNHVESK